MTSDARTDVDFEIAPSVIAKVVRLATLDVEGVAGISTNLAARLGKKTQGINIRQDEEQTVMDIHIVGQFGFDLRELAQQVQGAVAQAVQAMLDPVALVINVYVDDVIVNKEGNRR
jgi:uncharacterized alkaline shock family protein YloU